MASDAVSTIGVNKSSPSCLAFAFRLVADAVLTRSVSPAGTGLPVAPAADPVELLPGARRLAVRAFAGGFWSEPGTGEVGVQPPVRATGLEVAIESSDGARYVRVFAL